MDETEEKKVTEARKRLEMYPDFHLILTSQDTLKRLNMLLKPATALSGRDLSFLAGELEFKMSEIDYINTKEYPLLYLFDQYLKRSLKDPSIQSTLKHVHGILVSMKRYDAAEVIEQELQALQNKDPKELSNQESMLKEKLSRRMCNFVPIIPNIINERQQQSSAVTSLPTSVNKPMNKPLGSKKQVYVINCADDEKHVKNVRNFTKKLRSFGIDASSDMFEKLSYDQEPGFYIASNILQADYVVVVCSPLFKKAYDYCLQDKQDELGEETYDEVKKILFYMRMISTDIFESYGRNGKFIPVVFNSRNVENIPQLLKGSTCYIMEKDIKKLRFRLLGIEEYKLGPTPKTKPVIATKTIGNGLQLLKITKQCGL